MSKSSIEWTEQTWNPTVGCSLKSPGCTNCYAMPMAARIEAMNLQAREAGKKVGAPQYDGTTTKANGNAVWTGKLALAGESTLLAPLKRKKPTLYFVNSMGDLFHEDCKDEWIDRVFAVMALCPQHTFQVLTKRAKRMRAYWQNMLDRFDAIEAACEGILDHRDVPSFGGRESPLENIWLGVSTERQQEADERIPFLLETPASVRFISAEPLLGPMDLIGTLARYQDNPARRPAVALGRPLIDWLITGGESGHGARPMHPDWARSLRDQCAAAGVPFFFKQWGNWHPEIDRDRDDPDWRQPYSDYKEPHFQILNLAGGRGFHGERVHVMRYCSKKSAGRTLDGITHNEMPAAFEGRLSPVGKTLEGAGT